MKRFTATFTGTPGAWNAHGRSYNRLKTGHVFLHAAGNVLDKLKDMFQQKLFPDKNYSETLTMNNFLIEPKSVANPSAEI
jgi:hypothetical protein